MPSLILALAFAVSSMTALRQGGAYGPSDLFLMFAVVVAVAAALNRLFAGETFVSATPVGRLGAEAARPTLVYSGVSMFLILISTLANWQVIAQRDDPLLALAGYVVSFALVAVLFLEASWGELPKVMVGFCNFSLAILIFYLVGFAIGYEPFFFYHRFIGLSENPNQTALQMLCIIIVAVSVLGKLDDLSPTSRLSAWACIVLATIIGIVTASDAFAAALVVMFVVGAAHFLILRTAHNPTWFGAVYFVLLPLSLAVLLLVVDDLPALVGQVLDRIELGNQDSIRFLLWSNGLLAWQESWLFGNGPGGWSGLSGPFEGSEAHNTFIDILTITGICGLIAYVAFLVTLFRRKMSHYIPSYYCLLGLLTFTIFHFTLRHPIFWFAIIGIHMASMYRRADGQRIERIVGKGGLTSPTSPARDDLVSAAGTPAA